MKNMGYVKLKEKITEILVLKFIDLVRGQNKDFIFELDDDDLPKNGEYIKEHYIDPLVHEIVGMFMTMKIMDLFDD